MRGVEDVDRDFRLRLRLFVGGKELISMVVYKRVIVRNFLFLEVLGYSMKRYRIEKLVSLS